MSELTPADDSLHPAASTDRWWTETCWFSFDQPGPDLSATFYPLLRPNLAVASLAVYVWGPEAHEPHRIRYGRSLWHLAMPDTDLAALRLEGLAYDALEPLERYRVRYDDPGLLTVDVEYEGLRPARPSGVGGGHGHLDQPCRVRGEVRIGDQSFEIDSLAMRDRSWHVRPDDRSMRAGYSYGNASADEQFLAVSVHETADRYRVVTGYLVRDGVEQPVTGGTRTVTARDEAGYPLTVEMSLTDGAGRVLETSGRTRNRLANQATPGLFAWLSMTEWDAFGTCFGEDQDIWSPDQLARAVR